jgi:hypothetical protein
LYLALTAVVARPHGVRQVEATLGQRPTGALPPDEPGLDAIGIFHDHLEMLTLAPDYALSHQL